MRRAVEPQSTTRAEGQGQDRMREAVRAALTQHFGDDGLAYWQTFFEPLAQAPWAEVLAGIVGPGAGVGPEAINSR